MTREERHIAVLNRLLENMNIFDSVQPTEERKKAIKAAIQALSQISDIKAIINNPMYIQEDVLRYQMICEVVKPSITQKSETVTEFADRCRECGARYGELLKQKSGVWVEIDDEPHEVWECDHCGFVIDGSGCIEPYEYRDIYKYCPNCGCRMVEPQESEE